MATYVPNATQATEPVESRTVESAALEFRTLKGSINTRISSEIAARSAADEVLQTNIDNVEANSAALVNAEQVARISGDASLQAQVSAFAGSTSIGGADKVIYEPVADAQLVSIDAKVSGVPRNIWLVLESVIPVTGVVVNVPADVFDGQRVSVTSTEIIRDFTVAGGTVLGAPQVMAADGSFQLRYAAATATWYRCD